MLDVYTIVFLIFFFMLWTSGALNIANKWYTKYKLCLGLVGVRYPSELELPVICKRLVHGRIICTCVC